MNVSVVSGHDRHDEKKCMLERLTVPVRGCQVTLPWFIFLHTHCGCDDGDDWDDGDDEGDEQLNHKLTLSPYRL